MERPEGAARKKSPKQGKAARKEAPKPIKVVYISNPMKIKASVAEFRAVVQELTGRDSDVADFSKYAGSAAADGDGHGEPPPPPAPSDHPRSPGLGVFSDPPQPTNPDDGWGGADLRSDGSYEARATTSSGEGFHDFVPEMLDDFPVFLPSPLYYGP